MTENEGTYAGFDPTLFNPDELPDAPKKFSNGPDGRNVYEVISASGSIREKGKDAGRLTAALKIARVNPEDGGDLLESFTYWLRLPWAIGEAGQPMFDEKNITEVAAFMKAVVDPTIPQAPHKEGTTWYLGDFALSKSQANDHFALLKSRIKGASYKLYGNCGTLAGKRFAATKSTKEGDSQSFVNMSAYASVDDEIRSRSTLSEAEIPF